MTEKVDRNKDVETFASRQEFIRDASKDAYHEGSARPSAGVVAKSPSDGIE